jgi:hypothetical protein
MTSRIPEDIWSAISAAGQIDESCRPNIEGRIVQYKSETAKNDASKPTRRLVGRVRDTADKLKGLVQRLVKNDEYLSTGTDLWRGSKKIADPDIELLQQTIQNVTALAKEMDSAVFRFDYTKEFRPDPPLRDLIYWCLLIQANHLKRDTPTSTRETVASGKFRDYLKAIVEYATNGEVTQSEIDIEVTACIDTFRRDSIVAQESSDD